MSQLDAAADLPCFYLQLFRHDKKKEKKSTHTQKEALTSRRPPLLSLLPQPEEHSSLSCFVAKTQCRRRVYPKRPQCTTASCRGRVEAAAGNCLNATDAFFQFSRDSDRKGHYEYSFFPLGFFELKTTVASSCRGHRGIEAAAAARKEAASQPLLKPP